LQAVLINVTFYYTNPATLDTCEQFTERTVFSLEQDQDARVERETPVSFQVDSWELPEVQVMNGSDNSTGMHVKQGSWVSFSAYLIPRCTGIVW
jgi:hypothetical protein